MTFDQDYFRLIARATVLLFVNGHIVETTCFNNTATSFSNAYWYLTIIRRSGGE